MQVPTNEYQLILEDIAGVQRIQIVGTFLNLFLSLLRLFKFYQFQERLNVLYKTFAHAFVDLYHFVLMFGVIFGGFAVMAHFLFGLSAREYSSFGLSLNACWSMTLGEFKDTFPQMDYINPQMAAIFFIMFMFLVQMVCPPSALPRSSSLFRSSPVGPIAPLPLDQTLRRRTALLALVARSDPSLTRAHRGPRIPHVTTSRTSQRHAARPNVTLQVLLSVLPAT